MNFVLGVRIAKSVSITQVFHFDLGARCTPAAQWMSSLLSFLASTRFAKLTPRAKNDPANYRGVYASLAKSTIALSAGAARAAGDFFKGEAAGIKKS
jgi:hypothetical protein